VIGFAAMLRQEAGVLSEAARRHIDVISNSARQMGRLVDNLLDFSKMGRTEMIHGPVDMAELVKETLRDLAGDIDGRSIEWKIDPLPEVTGDRAMLKQAWFNLVSNAVKYTRKCEHARITIGCSRMNGVFEFVVQDNGAGFDMRYVDKLFGVFQRLHTTSEFEGTGVGLANVKRIVTRHGGETWARPRLTRAQASTSLYLTESSRYPVLASNSLDNCQSGTHASMISAVRVMLLSHV